MSLSVSFRFFVVVNNVQWGSCSLGLRASRYISQGSVSSGRVWTSPSWEQLGDIHQRLFPFTPHIRSESSQASHPRPHLLWWDIILWSGQWVWRDTSLLTWISISLPLMGLLCISIYLLVTRVFSSAKHIFISFVTFLRSGLFSLFYYCEGVLYILNMDSLLVVSVANIFSWSVVCFFTLDCLVLYRGF